MRDKLEQVEHLTHRLQSDYPQQVQGFLTFVRKAESGNALDIRTKGLINVGISVAAQCEWCIAFHVEQAIQAGAQRDQIVEAGCMGVVMHGGPAYMYLIPLLEAIDEFAADASGDRDA